MELEQIEHKRSDVFRIKGRVDSSNASELEMALLDKIRSGRGNLAVNLSGIEFMSSAALRALISALKETQNRTLGAGNLVLVAVPPHIREVFTIAALNSLFTFYDDEVTAVGSF